MNNLASAKEAFRKKKITNITAAKEAVEYKKINKKNEACPKP